MKFVIAHDLARRRAVAAVAEAPAGYVVTVKEPTRNLEQNALMWKWLQAFADQVPWPVNGAMVKLEAEEWKTLLTAGLRQESARLAMGLHGGVVMLGCSTRKLSRREMSELIEFIRAEAESRGVGLGVEVA